MSIDIIINKVPQIGENNEFTYDGSGNLTVASFGKMSRSISQTVGSETLQFVIFNDAYTGTASATFDVKITAGGNFQWQKDEGGYSGDVSITGSAQTLSDGVTVTLSTGYVVDDVFRLTLTKNVLSVLRADYTGSNMDNYRVTGE